MSSSAKRVVKRLPLILLFSQMRVRLFQAQAAFGNYVGGQCAVANVVAYGLSISIDCREAKYC